MAQISYGTITITDTNDIERIYVVYAKHTSNTDSSGLPAAANWKETIATAPGSGNYIWQRTVIKKTGTNELSYSDPVCVTGPEGDAAKNITDIETQYGISANWNTQPSSWSNDTPNYDSSKPNYWTRTRLKYEDNTYSSWIVNKDYALTKAVENSVLANSIAQSANENANGAMSQAAANIQTITRLWQAKSTHSTPTAPSTEITTGSSSTYNTWSTVKPTATDTYRYFYYCDQSKTGGGICTWSEVIEDTSYLSTYEINALNVRTQNFFKSKDNSYDGWIASGRSSDNGLNESNAETFFYNARFGATNISLGYNKTPVINLDGSNGTINIYRLPTIDSSTKTVTAAGSLGIQLSATSLNFYKPPVGNNSPVIAATLNANGLNITDGLIELANGTNDSIKISNQNFTRSINEISHNDLRLAIGSKFGVASDGTLYASNANISGTLTAGANSKIGPWNVTASSIWYGNSTFGNANGIYLGTSGLSLGSAFQVTNTGIVTANNITATGGKIGGWNIGTDTNKSFYYGNQTPGATTTNLVLSPTSATNANAIAGSGTGKTWFISAGQKFGVDTSGNLYATGATISGKITVSDESDLSAGLSAYSTTSQMDAAIGNATNDMATKTYVGNQGYQTANNVSNIINNTNVSSLKDGSSYATKTYAENEADAAQAAAELTAQGYANTAEANASYSVEVKVTAIDYTNSSATLVAVPYYQGSTTLPTLPNGASYSYQWYRGTTALSNTSTAPTISGATTATLVLGQGSDLAATYVCVISKP